MIDTTVFKMTEQPQTSNLNDEDMLNAFGQMQKQSEISEVLKELFSEKKIFMITDLTSDEISLLTRIYMIAEMKNIAVWKKGLIFYIKLLLSRNRKSRKEIIDAVKGYQTNQSLISKMNPSNWLGGGGMR